MKFRECKGTVRLEMEYDANLGLPSEETSEEDFNAWLETEKRIFASWWASKHHSIENVRVLRLDLVKEGSL